MQKRREINVGSIYSVCMCACVCVSCDPCKTHVKQWIQSIAKIIGVGQGSGEESFQLVAGESQLWDEKVLYSREILPVLSVSIAGPEYFHSSYGDVVLCEN